LFVSGVNTILGYSVTLFFRYIVGLADPFPVVLNFVLCFPLAYTMQTKIAFRTEWQLPRMFAYALTSLPNLAMQWILTALIPETAMVGWLRYAVICILPLPVMFFIIRFIVTPLKEKHGSK